MSGKTLFQEKKKKKVLSLEFVDQPVLTETGEKGGVGREVQT